MGERRAHGDPRREAASGLAAVNLTRHRDARGWASTRRPALVGRVAWRIGRWPAGRHRRPTVQRVRVPPGPTDAGPCLRQVLVCHQAADSAALRPLRRRPAIVATRQPTYHALQALPLTSERRASPLGRRIRRRPPHDPSRAQIRSTAIARARAGRTHAPSRRVAHAWRRLHGARSAASIATACTRLQPGGRSGGGTRTTRPARAAARSANDAPGRTPRGAASRQRARRLRSPSTGRTSS